MPILVKPAGLIMFAILKMVGIYAWYHQIDRKLLQWA